MKFEDLTPSLDPKTLECIVELGYTEMTPVQAATIPLFLSGKDVCVDACTGSGKTVAFIIPIAELLVSRMKGCVSLSSRKCKLRALIVSPTRELSGQIYQCANFFFQKIHQENVSVFNMVGGTSVDDDLNEISNACGKSCVLIGTPGRLGDILTRSIGVGLDVEDFEVLVLDEADTLLDMGFQQTLSNILSFLPKQRRTGLFSATQTKEVKSLARAGLRNPATVSVHISNSTQKTPTTLDNFYTFVDVDKKLSLLVAKLIEYKKNKIIVFFSSCACVDFFATVLSQLPKLKFLAKNFISLHGKMTQKKRTLRYQQFVSLETGVLVCTDVVARGVDIPDVDWIIQFDPPQDPSFFVHRVGRTARAGKSGCALTFLSHHEDTYINFLALKNVPTQELPLPSDIPDVLGDVKKLVMQDRDVLEKGTNAFISFIRAYKEHQCEFIFQFKKLDLGAVARSFALLQLPRITELKKVNIDFEKEESVVISEIKFKDKVRENQRQLKLLEMGEQMAALNKKKKQEKALAAKVQDAPRRRDNKKGMKQRIEEEWDDLANEERLFKKLKKGKISRDEYENELDGKLMDEDEVPSKKKNCLDKFKKRSQEIKKTREQKEQRAKREERIRKRKKANHLKNQKNHSNNMKGRR